MGRTGGAQMRPEKEADQRHLAALQKYAPFKALASQRLSNSKMQAGDVNQLMHRWKPCPKDIAS
jgi:hypothetical protein